MTQPVAKWRSDSSPGADDPDHDVAGRFQELARQWKADTLLLSSSTAISSHPAYQAIIALGPPVLPLILHDLEAEPAHWLEELQVDAGGDQVPLSGMGTI